MDMCIRRNVDVCVHALLVSSSDRQWPFVYFGGQSILFFIPFPLQPTCAIASALTCCIRGCHSNWLTPPTDSPATPLWPPARLAVGGSRCPQKRFWHPPLSEHSLKMSINALWWEPSLNTCHSQIHASSFFPLFLLESVLQKHTAGSFLTNKNEKENRRPDVSSLPLILLSTASVVVPSVCDQGSEIRSINTGKSRKRISQGEDITALRNTQWTLSTDCVVLLHVPLFLTLLCWLHIRVYKIAGKLAN